MSGDTPQTDAEAAATTIGGLARDITDGFNGVDDAPPTPPPATDDAAGDTTATPPPPAPATDTPPPAGQGQNWLLDLLATKFGFSSGQDFMSGIIDMLFGKLDLSGIPIIGDLFSHGNDAPAADNDGPATPEAPVQPDPAPAAETTVADTPRTGLDGINGRDTFTGAAAPPAADNTANVDPSLIPSGPPPGAGNS